MLNNSNVRGYIVENAMSVRTFVSDGMMMGYEMVTDRYEHIGVFSGSVFLRDRLRTDGLWEYMVVGADGREWWWLGVGLEDMVREGDCRKVLMEIRKVGPHGFDLGEN